jgi:hypothetical protein
MVADALMQPEPRGGAEARGEIDSGLPDGLAIEVGIAPQRWTGWGIGHQTFSIVAQNLQEWCSRAR